MKQKLLSIYELALRFFFKNIFQILRKLKNNWKIFYSKNYFLRRILIGFLLHKILLTIPSFNKGSEICLWNKKIFFMSCRNKFLYYETPDFIVEKKDIFVWLCVHTKLSNRIKGRRQVDKKNFDKSLWFFLLSHCAIQHDNYSQGRAINKANKEIFSIWLPFEGKKDRKELKMLWPTKLHIIDVLLCKFAAIRKYWPC